MHRFAEKQQLGCAHSYEQAGVDIVDRSNHFKSNMSPNHDWSSTRSYLQKLNNHNRPSNDPNSMLNPYCRSKYSIISVIDSYRNFVVNLGLHCFGSTTNTAPCVYGTNYWGQDYSYTNIGFSTDYVCYYNQKEKDSTGVFSKFYHKVDYISTNSSKLWNNIYEHPNENNNMKGFYYLINGVIHDCPVIPDGILVVLESGVINIAVECVLVNHIDSNLVMKDF